MVCHYRPQRSCGKVMFLHLSVILFTGGVADTPQEQTPPGADMIPRADTPPGADPPGADTPPGADMIPSSRHTPRSRPPQEQTPPCSACWEIRATSGWYASYWNAYLFSPMFPWHVDHTLRRSHDLCPSVNVSLITEHYIHKKIMSNISIPINISWTFCVDNTDVPGISWDNKIPCCVNLSPLL